MLPPAGHWIWDKNEYKIPPCWFGGQCQAPVFGQKWWQSLKSVYINILAPASIFSSLKLVLVVMGQMLPPTLGHLVATTKNKIQFCEYVNHSFISLSLYTHKNIYYYQKNVMWAQLQWNGTCRWQRDSFVPLPPKLFLQFLSEIKN